MKIQKEALKLIGEILQDPAIPNQLKGRISVRIAQPGVKENDLRSSVATVRNPALPVAARQTAMDRIVDLFKGEL